MTFQASLALLLLLIGCICLVVTIPQMVKGIEKMLAKAEMAIPPQKILISGIALQNVFMLIAAIAVGSLLAPKTGLQVPVLEALLSGSPVWSKIKPQLISGVIAGLVSVLVFIPVYYIYFIRHLDSQTIWAVENRRLNLNLIGRLLYNGIFEEIIARWGVMTLFVWLGSLLSGKTSSLIFWLAILASGIVMAWLYLPDFIAAGSVKSRPFFAYISFKYLWNAVIFGWLFWHYGLEAAFLAHMIFLLIWYPYDMRMNIAKKIDENR